MWRSKPSESEVWRNRATVVTNVVKPTAAQPVHAGGLQSRPKSDLLHDFTMAESSRAGYAGTGSCPQGGCGPSCAYPRVWQSSIANNTNRTRCQVQIRYPGTAFTGSLMAKAPARGSLYSE